MPLLTFDTDRVDAVLLPDQVWRDIEPGSMLVTGLVTGDGSFVFTAKNAAHVFAGPLSSILTVRYADA